MHRHPTGKLLVNAVARKVQRGGKVQRGFTLVELMTALAVLVVLLSLAAPDFGRLLRDSKLSTVTNGLAAAIGAARTEAGKRATWAMLQPADGTDWSSGWIAFADTNMDGRYDQNLDVLVAKGQLPDASFALAGDLAENGAGRPYLMFDALGYSRTLDGGFRTSTIEVQSKAGTPLKARIKVSATGRVRACRPTSPSDPACSPEGG